MQKSLGADLSKRSHLESLAIRKPQKLGHYLQEYYNKVNRGEFACQRRSLDVDKKVIRSSLMEQGSSHSKSSLLRLRATQAVESVSTLNLTPDEMSPNSSNMSMEEIKDKTIR